MAPKPVFRATSVVGRGGLEPPTSRLSGVRSNHLSYRPLYRHKPPKGRFSAYRPAQLSPQFRCGDLQDAGTRGQSGRAHVRTPATTTQFVSRPLLEKKIIRRPI